MNKKDIKKSMGIILCILIYMLFITVTGIGCPIRWLTGIPCPGCGMTRSFIALLHLNLIKSFYLHPSTIIAVPFMLYLIIGKKPLFNNIKVYKASVIVFITIMLIIWVIRILFFQNNIFYIDIKSSAIFRLFNILKEVI